MSPVINWNKCDGCGRCVKSCPAHVLDLRNLSRYDYDRLNFCGKLKWRIKGGVRAYVLNQPDCVGCRICQMHCHERALKMM